MTWSYSGDPSTSDRDSLRFLIGDTDSNDQLLQDEELDYILATFPSLIKAQYIALSSIAAKCARLYRQETGRIKVWAGDKYKQYKDLADQLKDDMARGIVGTPYVFAGGISHSDVQARNSDPDRVQIPAKPGVHDNLRGSDSGEC